MLTFCISLWSCLTLSWYSVILPPCYQCMPPSATGSHAALCCTPPASCNILQIDVFMSGGKLLVSSETLYHKSLTKNKKQTMTLCTGQMNREMKIEAIDMVQTGWQSLGNWAESNVGKLWNKSKINSLQ